MLKSVNLKAHTAEASWEDTLPSWLWAAPEYWANFSPTFSSKSAKHVSNRSATDKSATIRFAPSRHAEETAI